MINSVKARTPILALILFVFSIGFTVAATNKVVVIPMAGDSTDPAIIQDLTDRIAALESTQPLAYGTIGWQGNIITSHGVTSVSIDSTAYVVIIDKTIAGSPTVVATAINSEADTEIITYEAPADGNTITFRVVNEDNAIINSGFSFVVHGTAQ